MMLTGSSYVILTLGLLAIVLPNLRFSNSSVVISEKRHREICFCIFAVGCIVRLFKLGTLPGGVFAEEALLGVQAKALWQTGGFLFEGGLTTQLAQWSGESTGPLLAVITAPFVGLFGMNPLVVRLPLVLLSCVAMASAYGLGSVLGGRRAARWTLAAYALCPYFVLMSRMACGANAAVFLLPAAMYMMVRGLKNPGALYIGMVLTALLAYAQNMYFFIAPVAIVLASALAVAYGVKVRHAVCASALGLLICLPALMTIWVNLCGGESFTFMGLVHIPKMEVFDKANNVTASFEQDSISSAVQNKIWTVLVGAVFQVLVHMNISAEMFAPAGMGALYVLSIPLILLGVVVIANRVFSGKGKQYWADGGRMMVSMFFIITLLMLTIFGSIGLLNKEGASSVFDYSALLLFDVLLMVAGLCRMEKKSKAGSAVLATLFLVCFVMQCVYLFGPSYQENANVYFKGFSELTHQAKQAQEKTGAKVNVTSRVYPHIAPSDAAEIMYLYAADADLKKAKERRGVDYEVIYAPGVDTPDPEQIYLIAQGDASEWDFSQFEYEESGEYILLTPIQKQ